MSKLLCLKGLPASGKSTHAFELVKQGWKRVNKDDLRAMIDGGKWSKENEKLIVSTQANLVNKFLDNGNNVVIDNTNYGWEDHWKLVAEQHGVEFEVMNFDTPPDECVMRDAKRGDKSVGADVIYRMYRQYVEPNIVKPVYDETLLDCYIFDIDGTLAIMGNRSPFEWSKVGIDKINYRVAQVLFQLKASGKKIIIMSGRDSVCENETREWLEKNDIKYNHLLMRAEGDTRKDSIVKKELYDNYIKGKYNVLGVFDDRNQVVALWRSLGLTCFQVAEGNF